MFRIGAVMVTVGLMAFAATAGAQQPVQPTVQQPVAPAAPAQVDASQLPAPAAAWTPPQRPGVAPETETMPQRPGVAPEAPTMPHEAAEVRMPPRPIRVIPVERGNAELIAALLGGYAVYDEPHMGGIGGIGGMGGYGGYGGYAGRTTGTRDTRGIRDTHDRGYTDRGVGHHDTRTTRGTTRGRTTDIW